MTDLDLIALKLENAEREYINLAIRVDKGEHVKRLAKAAWKRVCLERAKYKSLYRRTYPNESLPRWFDNSGRSVFGK